jgi:hypothetical protein
METLSEFETRRRYYDRNFITKIFKDLQKRVPSSDSKEKTKKIALFFETLYKNIPHFESCSCMISRHINLLVILLNRLEDFSSDELFIKEMTNLNLNIDTIKNSLFTIILKNLVVYNRVKYRVYGYDCADNIKRLINNIKNNDTYKTKQIETFVHTDFIDTFCNLKITELFVSKAFFDILYLYKTDTLNTKKIVDSFVKNGSVIPDYISKLYSTYIKRTTTEVLNCSLLFI